MFDIPIHHEQNIITEVTLPFYLGAIIKIPTEKEEILSYSQLECSEEDRAKIYELIETMGNNGKITLLLKYKTHLEKLGDEVRHVHSLKFLGVIYSHPVPKQCMKEVLNDYFKRINFIDGLATVIETEIKKGSIDKCLIDFAKDVNVNHYDLIPFIKKKNWRGFLEHISNN